MNSKPNLLPFRYYFIPVLIAVITGLANMIYLFVSHYRMYTDIGYESFCAISAAINCDTVSQSPYSVFLGVPVAVWGILGHLFVIYILFLAGTSSANRQRMWPLLFWIALAFTLYSLVLAYISTFIIQSHCIMCILGYLVNFALLYYAWFINRRFGNTSLFSGLTSDFVFLKDHWKSAAPIIIFLLAFTAIGPFGFPKYWELREPSSPHALPSGTTEAGHPWIGAEDPVLVIEEFTDYMCFHCRTMHYHLRRLVEAHPEKIRIVHRHFPMDHRYNPIVQAPHHEGAGVLALFAIHAKNEGKFWEANDYFYFLGARREAFGTTDIASTLGLSNAGLVNALNDREYLTQLINDIRTGLELGITATPAYVIDGDLYQGQIPSRILREY